VSAFPLPLRSASIGFFFGFFRFDFPTEFFVFGVFGFAAFVLIDLFDRDRFVFVLVSGFVVVNFGFVFFIADKQRHRCDREWHRVRRGGRGQQHQRGEQEDQQVRKFPHGPLIGAMREAI
jgi:hypothetical protein